MLDEATKTWIEVSKSALLANVREIKAILKPGVELMAVVKSNAYGHGIRQVVETVGRQVDWFAVDSLTEGELVRESDSEVSILILGHTPFEAHERVVRGGFRQVVYDCAAVESLAAAAKKVGQPVKIHLKIETGTYRQGMDVDELAEFVPWLMNIREVELEGVYTHYANIEDTKDASHAMNQLKRFKQAVQIVRSAGGEPKLLHASCSAAVLLYPETHFDLGRVGASLYGYWPSELTRENVKLGVVSVALTPALTWKTRIAQVKDVTAGTPISYGLVEQVSRDSRIAVLPVGYWDGYDRGLSSVGYVLIAGKRAKVMGRVCMNMFMVDVTDIVDVEVGDEVVLLGSQGDETITPEDMSSKVDTINYEVLARINPTLPRILVD